MPELAEVEAVRSQLENKLKGQKIADVTLDEGDRYLFAYAKPSEVRKALLGAKVTGCGRKGKYFWLEMNRKPWPIFHLGMSGNIALLSKKSKNAKHEKIWGGAKMWSEGDPKLESRLWFCRLLLTTHKGLEMAFIDPRRFGRMWLSDNPSEHPRIRKLGFDPLIDFPPVKDLGLRLKKRHKAIKAVLLDQNLFAGIGNWLADEILYQARISPHHQASSLTAAQVKSLHRQVLAVTKKASAVSADYERFPKTWLFHHRWGKNKNAKTSRGQKIIHEEVGGRTTAWVPGWQR